LLAHDQWFSLGTLASSTTKTGCPDIAEILQTKQQWDWTKSYDNLWTVKVIN
jgi:hypothetical protein